MVSQEVINLLPLILHLESVVAGLLLEFAAMSKSGEKGLSGGTPSLFGTTGSDPHLHARHTSLLGPWQACAQLAVDFNFTYEQIRVGRIDTVQRAFTQMNSCLAL